MMVAPYARPRHVVRTAARIAFALLVLAIALANAVAVLTPRPLQQALAIERLVDLDSFGWGRLGTVAVCALMLVVVNALLRGKRHAWLLSAGLLAFSLVSSVVSQSHRGYVPVAMFGLVVLLALAPLFPARSDPRALRRGYVALAVCIICYVSHGLVVALWHHELALGDLRLTAQWHFFLLNTLRLVLFLFLGYSVVEILRPVLNARRLSLDERRRVAALLERHGAQTTAHFALQPEMSYFWSPEGLAVVAYRLVAGAALVLGEPIGSEDEIGPLLLAFVEFCKRQDWAFAVYQAGPRVQRLCRALGHQAYKVGEEAIVTTADFTTQGKAGAPVRHSIARARRDGVTVRCYQGESVPDATFAGMRRISQTWLEAQGSRTQMGFSMGRFPADWSPDLLTTVALDAQGEVQAFLTWTPLYAGNGWSLDNIRRTKATTPGTMEMLIAESIEWAQARGYGRMSLGLAPLAGLDSKLNADLRSATCEAAQQEVLIQPRSWLERSAAFLYQRKLLLAGYASLYHFKSKFRPEWEPRYLVVTDTRALPRVAAAMMRAHGYTWWRVVHDSGLPARLSPLSLLRRGHGGSESPSAQSGGQIEEPAHPTGEREVASVR